MNAVPDLRQPLPRAHLRLGERRAERLGAAHDFAGRLHLGAEQRVDAREPHEREHRRLHEEAGHLQVLGEAQLGQRLPDHQARGDLGERRAGRLRQIRHRA